MDIQNVERAAVRVGRLVRHFGSGGVEAVGSGVCGDAVAAWRGFTVSGMGRLWIIWSITFLRGRGRRWFGRLPGRGEDEWVGAVATLLDLLFKPGCQVRIIGGSREQSEKMYVYLCGLVERRFRDLILGRVTKKGFGLVNGSRVEILAQSAKAVRRGHLSAEGAIAVEIELFKEEVWKAVQLTTRSVKTQSDVERRTTKDERRNSREIENVSAQWDTRPAQKGWFEEPWRVFSTMHVPGGLMQRIVEERKDERRETKDETGAERIFRGASGMGWRGVIRGGRVRGVFGGRGVRGGLWGRMGLCRWRM